MTIRFVKAEQRGLASLRINVQRCGAVFSRLIQYLCRFWSDRSERVSGDMEISL